MTLGEKIERFLAVGYGYGDGYGDGSGSGSGDGDGDGDGYGSGDGYGYGDGYGDGIKVFEGHKVYRIDNVNTCITDVKLNVAKGFILNNDLTTSPCYIVKGDNKFAHGETIAQARQSLMDKIFEDMPEDERIDAFLEEFEQGKQYSGRLFYEWHHKLTGSCEMGRNAFVKDHGLDLDKTYTLNEFIDITEHAYGGDIIKKIKERITKGEYYAGKRS